jgi:lambda repressor-like predicted transcriptional regulator
LIEVVAALDFDALREEIIEIVAHYGLSMRFLANQTGLEHTTIQRYLQNPQRGSSLVTIVALTRALAKIKARNGYYPGIRSDLRHHGSAKGAQ